MAPGNPSGASPPFCGESESVTRLKRLCATIPILLKQFDGIHQEEVRLGSDKKYHGETIRGLKELCDSLEDARYKLTRTPLHRQRSDIAVDHGALAPGVEKIVQQLKFAKGRLTQASQDVLIGGYCDENAEQIKIALTKVESLTNETIA